MTTKPTDHNSTQQNSTEPKETNIMTHQTTTTHINDLTADRTEFGNFWLTQLRKEEVKELITHLKEV